MARGWFIASLMARGVISVNTTRPERDIAIGAAELRRALGPGHLRRLRLRRFNCRDALLQHRRLDSGCRRRRPSFHRAQPRFQLLDLQRLLLHQRTEFSLAQGSRRVGRRRNRLGAGMAAGQQQAERYRQRCTWQHM